MRTWGNHSLQEWNSGFEVRRGRWPKAVRVSLIFVASGLIWALVIGMIVAYAAVLQGGGDGG